MSNEKTGGPAYPSANDVRIDTPQGAMGTGGHPGMTILDHFAGLAMQGLLDRSPRDAWGNVPDAGTSEIAEEAYQYAAAMIAERNRLMNP